MSAHKYLAAALAASLLAGCSGTVHRIIDIDSGKGLSVDARQRLLLVTEKGGRTKDQRLVCAEPSPDAIVARAAALGASANAHGQGAASPAGSSSEAAAAIGLRSQTIQLLRDGYYRLCEALMNGSLSRQQYNLALVNFDKVMIPAMAIDAIAGAPRPPAIAIAPGAAGVDTNPRSEDDSGGKEESTAGSSTTQGAIASTKAAVKIEEARIEREALSEHASNVLIAALDVVKETPEDSLGLLCVSYISDPDSLQPSHRAPAIEHKERLGEICNKLVNAMVKKAEVEATQSNVTLQKELAKAKQELAKTKGDLEQASKKAGAAAIQTEDTETGFTSSPKC